MKVKDSLAGQRGLCPYCHSEVLVQTAEQVADLLFNEIPIEPENPAKPEIKPPTEKQLAFARNLGVKIPVGVNRKELGRLIDEALDDAPATPGQIEFLEDLGIKCPPNIRSKQMSLLLDTALGLEAQVQEGVQRKLTQQWKDAGFLTYEATDEQLMKELLSRGRCFFMFVLKDDEFRYDENKPMQGELLWTENLNEGDVRWAIMMLNKEWNKKFDIQKYADDYDGKLPKFKFKA
jgi:hypothetical protein